MRFGKAPVKRGGGVKVVVRSISLNENVDALLESYLQDENISRSYFVQECIKKGLERHKESGFVYVIKWGEKDYEGKTTVKIGKTKNPTARLNQLAGGSDAALPVKLEMMHLIECEHAKKVESALHKYFAKNRIETTEYFLLQDEDLKWILTEGYLDLRGIQQYISF